MISAIVDRIIRRACRTPYFHLYHRDGSIYMQRYWLMPRFMLEKCNDPDRDNVDGEQYYRPKRWVPFSLKLHHICTIDYDRDMHNHPWAFVSLVLRGGYIEKRPLYDDSKFHRCIDIDNGDEYWTEPGRHEMRMAGDVAYRSASDRHVIISVIPQTWTLLLQFRKSQEWGFFTPQGFVPWREYHGIKLS